uniref:FmdB family zinc ribbon protein n=1 Tax=Candidatus Planktophila sp. TaxID=2175601 RepID=UPI00404A5E05
MPTYQYACSDCGHQFEAFQTFSEASLTSCPECKGTIRKVYSAVGVVFKGSGFYKTDSAKSTNTEHPLQQLRLPHLRQHQHQKLIN